MKNTNNIRIKQIKPLISPEELKKLYPMTDKSCETVTASRKIIQDIVHLRDSRLLGIVGPCSIHDLESAREYAARFNELRKKVEDRIYLVMRVYYEKPRTTIGWRGLLVDPHLDGSNDMETGLKWGRQLLVELNEMGIPTASEMLDPIIPQYIADLVSWAAIGARTSESQTHRDMVSGLSMPVGLKNGTDGSLIAAMDAIEAARHPKSFIGIDQQGRTSIFETAGNEDGHLILRGGRTGPNYYLEHIEEAVRMMNEKNLTPSVMVDCSHMNSTKKASKQSRVLAQIVQNRNLGCDNLIGFMLESNLFGGKQTIPVGQLDQLKYGVSVTDECIGWDETVKIIEQSYEDLEL